MKRDEGEYRALFDLGTTPLMASAGSGVRRKVKSVDVLASFLWGFGVVAWMLTASGCPAKKGSKSGRTKNPKRVTRKKAAPCPRYGKMEDMAAVILDGRLPLQGLLPPTYAFSDPEPVPKHLSLKRLRRRASGFLRERRWRANAQLAALLWKLANKKMRLIHKLSDTPKNRKKKILFKRQVHAHLQECVALLEGVVSEKKSHYLARFRLAHYLRELHPFKAIVHFKTLLKHPKSQPRRREILWALGRLYLAKGTPQKALSFVKTCKKGEGAFLRALALFRMGKAQKAATVLHGLVSTSQNLSQKQKHFVEALLPALWALSPPPTSPLQKWKGIPWLQPKMKKLASQALRLAGEFGVDQAKLLSAVARAAGTQAFTNKAKAINTPRQCVNRLRKVGRFCWYKHGYQARQFLAPPPRQKPHSNDSKKTGRAPGVWKLKLQLSGVKAGGNCAMKMVTSPPTPPPPAVSVSLSNVAKCLSEKTTSCLRFLEAPKQCPLPTLPQLNLELHFGSK